MTMPTSTAVPTREQARLRDRYGPAAVVSGATSGIGRSCATYLAAAGFDLAVVARDDLALARLANELESDHGVTVHPIAADLSTPDGIDEVAIAARSLDVGLFVPAAGFGTSGPLVDHDAADEIDMITVNCTAVLALTHHFARRMIERGSGGIVVWSSIVATQGVPRSANYAATKAYVQTLAEGLRHELGPHGVDVLTSAPGPVASNFGARADLAMGGGAAPDLVARATLRALGRRAVVRPGRWSKLLGWSLALCPRRLRTRILAGIFRGFTKHQVSSP